MLPFWKDSSCLLIPSWNLPFWDDYGLNVRYYILLNLGEWKVQKNTFARLSESLKSKILATMVPPPRYSGSITNLPFWVIPRLEGMKTGLSKIAKASMGISPGPQGFTAPHMNPQLPGSTVLMHIVSWPMTIKLNPSWKTEVSKCAWIKPWRRWSFWDIWENQLGGKADTCVIRCVKCSWRSVFFLFRFFWLEKISMSIILMTFSTW